MCNAREVPSAFFIILGKVLRKTIIESDIFKVYDEDKCCTVGTKRLEDFKIVHYFCSNYLEVAPTRLNNQRSYREKLRFCRESSYSM